MTQAIREQLKPEDINPVAYELITSLQCPKCCYIAKDPKDLIKHIWFNHCSSSLDLFNIYSVKNQQLQVCLCCGRVFNISNRQIDLFLKTFPRPFGCCRSHTSIISRLFYGCSFNDSKVQEKCLLNSRATNLRIYGIDNPWKTGHPGRVKYRKTMVTKYGQENPRKVPLLVAKALDTYKINHEGATSPFCFQSVQEKAANTKIQRYGTAYPSKDSYLRKQTVLGMLKTYNVDNPWKLPNNINAINRKRISQPNRLFKDFLDQNNIQSTFEYNIGKYYYDILIKDTNLVLEINPTYTHNSTIAPIFGRTHGNAKDKWYHRDKTIVAHAAGFEILHIFDWMSYEYSLNIINKLISLEHSNPIISTPRLHMYNPKTGEHLTDIKNKEQLIKLEFLEIYDSGQTY